MGDSLGGWPEGGGDYSRSRPPAAVGILPGMIAIRPMTAADLPLGMRLKDRAGWNQAEADWRRYLRLGRDGCFVAELDGTPVGTAVAFVFGPVAWVAMVLVDEAVRGRGVGTALVRHALAFLDGRSVRSVR